MSDFPAAASRGLFRTRCALGLALAASVVFVIVNRAWRDLPGRWWQGEKMKLEVLVPGCWWWAVLAVSVMLAGLLLTSRWWAKSWQAVRPAEPSRLPRWFVISLAGVMLTGAALRAPRLGLSLYNDEAHTFRAHLVGEIPKASLGDPTKFRGLSWWSTLFENRVGNNSLPFALLSRTSYDAWRGLSGAPAGRVNETALRLPVFLCGVLSIGALALLGRRLAGPGAGLAAGVLAALHPWHMRYSVEARSYGVLMLALPLIFLLLDRALRLGRWRDWAGFGVGMGVSVAVWLGTAHLLIALYGMLLLLALSPALKGRRLDLLVPAAVAGTLALGLYLLINLPLHLQLAKVLQDPLFFKSPRPFPLTWFQDVGSFLAFGIPGLPVDPRNTPQSDFSTLVSGSGLWGGVLVTALAVLLTGGAAGVWKLVRAGGLGLVLTGAFAGAALLTWAYCTAKGVVFLKWYAIFLLPGLLVILAVGWHALLGGGRTKTWGWIPVLTLLILAWTPGLKDYLTTGRENLRGAVETARRTSYPDSLTNPHNTLYAITWSESPIYDPTAITLKNAAGLEELVIRAGQEKRDLFVAHGHRSQARDTAGDVLGVLQNPARFRLAAVLPGLDEPSFTHYVYQLIPTSLTAPAPAPGPAPPPP